MSTEVCVAYDLAVEGGEETGGRWSQRTPEVREYTFKSVHVDYEQFRNRYPFNTGVWCDNTHVVDTDDVKPGDTLYLVEVLYDSGNTFGESLGHKCWPYAFKDASAALDACKAVEAGEPAEGTENVYRDWVGYFETFRSASVVTVTVV